MPLNVGKLNRYITIKRLVGTRDAAGQPTNTWETLRTDWAQILAPSGKSVAEKVLADRETNPVAYSFRVRYCTDVTIAMRVECEGVTYTVANVVPDVARREHTDIVGVAGVV